MTTPAAPDGATSATPAAGNSTPPPNTQQATPAGNASDDEIPYREAKKLIQERDAVKGKNKELEQELHEHREFKRKIMEQQGDYKGVSEQLKAENEKLKAEADARIKGDRKAALLKAVKDKTGIKSDTVLDGTLRVIAEAKGFDLAPAEISDEMVGQLVGHLRTAAPQLFTMSNPTPPVGPPGQPTNSQSIPSNLTTEGQQAAFQLAQARSRPGGGQRSWTRGA